MNYLEELKNKPSTKDIERNIVRVTIRQDTNIPQSEPAEKPEISKTNGPIITQELNVNYDREALKQKILANKLSKISDKTKSKPTVIEFQPVDETIENVLPSAEKKEPEKPPATKMKKKILLEIEEDKKELESIHDIRDKIFGSDEGDGEKGERITPKLVKTTTKTGKTGKSETIIHLEPHEYVKIGNVKTSERIGKMLDEDYPANPIVHKVSSYYMNNREIFVNFINSLFEQYTQELEKEDAENKISCDNIGSSSTTNSFSLLTHQKIVRDYLNLYTPYRGLLLYHGLGSG